MKWSLVVASLVGGLACSPTSQQAPQHAARPIQTCTSSDDCAVAVSRNPGDPNLRVKWALTLEEAGKAAMAAREFRAAIRLVTDDDDPIEDAASGLMRLGDPAGCVAELDAQLSSAGKDAALAGALRRARERCAKAAERAY